jgi:hypothetical protein
MAIVIKTPPFAGTLSPLQIDEAIDFVESRGLGTYPRRAPGGYGGHSHAKKAATKRPTAKKPAAKKAGAKK